MKLPHLLEGFSSLPVESQRQVADLVAALREQHAVAVASREAEIERLAREQRMTYAERLQVSSAAFQCFPIKALCLSNHIWLSLLRQGVYSIGDLLDNPPGLRLGGSGIGVAGVKVIEEKLNGFLLTYPDVGRTSTAEPPATIEAEASEPMRAVVPPPRVLRDEWSLFAEGAGHAGVEFSALQLDEDSRFRLIAAGINSLELLLQRTWTQLTQTVGFDAAELVLDAIVTAAAVASSDERRHCPVAPAADDVAGIIEQRWGDVPLRQLPVDHPGLSRNDRWRLGGSWIDSLTCGELLWTLDEPDASSFWDLEDYCEAWDKAVELSLRRGDALDYRRQRLRACDADFSLTVVPRQTLEVCTDREWRLLCAEFALLPSTAPQSPAAAAASCGIGTGCASASRQAAFKKMRSMPELSGLMSSLHLLLKQGGGIMQLEDAARELERHFASADIPSENIVRLLAAAGGKFRGVTRRPADEVPDAAPPRGGVILTKDGLEGFNRVIDTALALWKGRRKTIHRDYWLEMVVQAMNVNWLHVDSLRVLGCLRADGRFDPDRFTLAPVRLRAKRASTNPRPDMRQPVNLATELRGNGVFEQKPFGSIS